LIDQITTDDILSFVSTTVKEHAGEREWREYFKALRDYGSIGMASAAVVWRDDGTCRHLVQANSLLHFCSNVWSQRGDDGIIRRIFQVLGVEKGFFIEFGAWDGIHFANSRALAQRDWFGCFIEGDATRAERLKANYRDRPDILCLREMVLATPRAGGKTLDEIAQENFPAQHIDFLSIDVDGLDYRLFEEMKIRPSVVCMEGGFAWHPCFAQRLLDEVAGQNLGQPLAVMIEIARRKSYTPICYNQNMYLVADEHAGCSPLSGTMRYRFGAMLGSTRPRLFATRSCGCARVPASGRKKGRRSRNWNFLRSINSRFEAPAQGQKSKGKNTCREFQRSAFRMSKANVTLGLSGSCQTDVS